MKINEKGLGMDWLFVPTFYKGLRDSAPTPITATVSLHKPIWQLRLCLIVALVKDLSGFASSQLVAPILNVFRLTQFETTKLIKQFQSCSE